LAVKNLKVIKYELENNQKLINDFGRFYTSEETWSNHQIYVQRKENVKDPSIEAVGLLGAITGGRFDIIILDDVLDVLNTASEDQRAKVEDYIDGTLIPRLEPWGVIWGIGTRKHYDDYYKRCIEDKTWTVIHEKAIIREPEKWKIEELDVPEVMEDGMGNEVEVRVKAVIDPSDMGEVLWNDRWPMDKLLVLRYSLGSVVFNREYQNITLSDEDALFKIKDLEQCRDENISYIYGDHNIKGLRSDYMFIAQGADPSLVDDKKKAEKKDSDFTVYITIGVTYDGTEVFLGFFRERGLSPAKVQSTARDEYYRFMPYCMFWEANSFGGIHANNLINEDGIKLVKHITDRRKQDLYTGVPSMSVKFENRKFRLPYKTADDKKITNLIINEFHALGREKHDDIVMATWICSYGIDRIRKNLAKRGGKVERVKDVKRAKSGRLQEATQ